MLTTDKLLARASKAGIVPVLTIEDAAQAVPLAEALIEGGLDVLEVTLRTEAGLDAISAIAGSGLDVVLGAGTITRAEHVGMAAGAGAQFLVTPGTPLWMVPALRSFRGPILPGFATATEAMGRLADGFEVLKFFPAEASGGAAALKGLSGPLPDLKVMPTGGISLDNLETYLKLPCVIAAGGTWMAPQEAIRAGDWKAITKAARAAHEAAAAARQ